MAWMGLARHGTENPWHGWTLARHGTENPMAWMDPGTAWHGKPVGMDGPTSYVVPMVNFKNFWEFWHLLGGPEKMRAGKCSGMVVPKFRMVPWRTDFGRKPCRVQVSFGTAWHGSVMAWIKHGTAWHR